MKRARPDLDRVFAAANARLAELDVARCRALELAQTRAIRVVGPRPLMLKELLVRLEEEAPSEAWRARCHDSMRRVFRRVARDGQPSEALQTALNAYLDGQVALASEWMDIDTLLRPWGER